MSDTCSDFKFTRGERQANVKIGRGTESSNVIVFREQSCRTAVPPTDPCQADGSCTNKYKCWDHSDFTIALTTTTFSTKTGAIYDADIEVNAANNTVTLPESKRVEYDLQAIMTHEIGHFIGIAHSSDESAVMAPTYSPGSIAQRKLSADDVAAVCAIYPPKSGLVCAPEPRGGFGDEDPNATNPKACAVSSGVGSGALPVAALTIMGLGVLGAARRARRRTDLGRRS